MPLTTRGVAWSRSGPMTILFDAQQSRMQALDLERFLVSMNAWLQFHPDGVEDQREVPMQPAGALHDTVQALTRAHDVALAIGAHLGFPPAVEWAEHQAKELAKEQAQVAPLRASSSWASAGHTDLNGYPNQ